MNAFYDLSRQIASFNFFEWLLLAQAAGAKKIIVGTQNIKDGKWSRDLVKERAKSIILPGPALAGLPCEVGTFGENPVPHPPSTALVRFWKAGRRFRRLRSVKEPNPFVQYTVTLRNTQRANGRNSDEGAWRDFAQEIGAMVIEDYDDNPIHLHDRMALYAGAKMNYFVSNGPAVLCSFTEYPCMIFDCHLARGSLRADGIGEGQAYPWMVKDQYSVWEPATLDNIRRYHRAWKDGLLVTPDTVAPADPVSG